MRDNNNKNNFLKPVIEYDSDGEDDYSDDMCKVNTVICIEEIKRMHFLISHLIL